MRTPKLTSRQQLFVEYCRLVHDYPTQTDAYIAVYKPKGSRRTSMASASRIANKPAVLAYFELLRKIDDDIRRENERRSDELFRRQLDARINRSVGM